MRIYTRTGDGGTTGLLGGGRVSKSEDRIQALGSIDELSAAIGVVIAAPGIPAGACVMLEQVQRDLFELGALVARPGVDATDPFLEAEVRWLE